MPSRSPEVLRWNLPSPALMISLCSLIAWSFWLPEHSYIIVSSSTPPVSVHSLLWAVPCKTHTKHSQLQQSSFSTWANTRPMQQLHINTAHTQRGTTRLELWNRWTMKGKERSWFYGYISREKHQRKNPSQQWHLESKSRWHPQRDSREILLFLWLLRLLLGLLPFSEATAVVFRGTNLGSAPVAVI